MYLKKLEIKTSEESCILQINLGKGSISNFFIQKGGGNNEVGEGRKPSPTVSFPNRFLAPTLNGLKYRVEVHPIYFVIASLGSFFQSTCILRNTARIY